MAVLTDYEVLQYAGNGVATAFPVTWPFFTGTLTVTLVSSLGAETTLDLNTDYSVAGGTTVDGLPDTGTVTLAVPAANGVTVKIARATPKLQPATWDENDTFPQATIEAGFDRLTLMSQEGGGASTGGGGGMDLITSGPEDYWDAEDYIVRNIGTPTGASDAAPKSYVDAIAVDVSDAQAAAEAAAATATAAAATATLAEQHYNNTVANYVQPNSTVVYQHTLLDSIESQFDGVETTFNLLLGAAAYTPQSAAQLIVVYNGIYQEPGTVYTVASSQITFTSTPQTGDECFIIALHTNASAIVLNVSNSIVVGSPTGGNKGAGTINAQAVYDDNVLLTDYVFDIWQDGILRPEDRENARAIKFAPWRLDPEAYATELKDRRALPAMPSRSEWKGNMALGDLVQRLWETVECQSVHIATLTERLTKLERC